MIRKNKVMRVDRMRSGRRRKDRGFAMVEASIYFPLALIILFTLIILSAYKFFFFKFETEVRVRQVGAELRYENGTYMTDYSLGTEGSGVPTEAGVRNYYSFRLSEVLYSYSTVPLFPYQDLEYRAFRKLPKFLLKTGTVKEEEYTAKLITAYKGRTAEMCRLVDMAENSMNIYYHFGYTYDQLIERCKAKP